MSSGIIASVEPDIIDIEDELTDFAADLLALKKNETVLKCLFAQPAGTWVKATSCIDNTDQIYQEISSLQASCNGTLQITWLERPELGHDYGLVLFYVDSLGWNSLALYNRGLLA